MGILPYLNAVEGGVAVIETSRMDMMHTWTGSIQRHGLYNEPSMWTLSVSFLPSPRSFLSSSTYPPFSAQRVSTYTLLLTFRNLSSITNKCPTLSRKGLLTDNGQRLLRLRLSHLPCRPNDNSVSPISWRLPGLPMAKSISPRTTFRCICCKDIR
jgi:hypothetical protein